jgi:ABC-type bacteriocin/lantibiotic exporter with double-glycine peptidase domain
MHVVHTGKFSSAFHVSQWWPVLKKNFLGFLVAIIFLFGFYYFMMMAFSALYMSVVLCFVIPFAMAPLTFLVGLWTIPLFAQAYREEKPVPLAVPETEVLPAT